MSDAATAEAYSDAGFVVASQFRVDVLGALDEGPRTPSRIAEDNDIDVSPVSRALHTLREQDLVELLVPEERKKGRLYGQTDRGAEAWRTVEEVRD